MWSFFHHVHHINYGVKSLPASLYLLPSVSSLPPQFRRGEWTVGGPQPPGPSGQPQFWPRHPAQLPSQPAAGILPVPLRLGLRPFAQGSVQKLIHSKRPVSSNPNWHTHTHAQHLTPAQGPPPAPLTQRWVSVSVFAATLVSSSALTCVFLKGGELEALGGQLVVVSVRATRCHTD